MRDVYGNLLAFLHVEEIYAYDKEDEAQNAYGSIDAKHPVGRPPQPAARPLRRGPARGDPRPAALRLRRAAAHAGRASRALSARWAGAKIVAFQTRNPLHRAHEELTKRAAEQIGGGLLIHPVVGVTKPGDVDHYTRVRCYRALVDNYYEPGIGRPEPAAAGDADGRARERCCCTRSSAATTAAPTSSSAATTPGPATTRPASRSTRPMPPRSRWRKHEDEIGMEMVDFKQMVYLPERDRYAPVDEVPAGSKTADISGTAGPRQLPGQGPPAPRVVQPAGRGRDPERDQSSQVPPGPDALVHRASRARARAPSPTP